MDEQYISEEDVISLLQTLVTYKTENPPGDTLEAIKYIDNLFDEAGIPSKIHEYSDGHANLLAEYGEKRPSLLLTGHIDVVPAGDVTRWTYPPFKGTEVGSKIYGRGTVDMKGAVAAFIAVLLALKKLDVELDRKVKLLITSDEEALMEGAKAALAKGIMEDCEFVLIGEPTGLHIGRAEKSVQWVNIHVKGKAAHGATPELGNNAIEAATDLFPEIKSILPPTTHELLGRPTINISRIKGGEPFSVPESCEFDLDYRLVPNVDTTEVKKALEETIEEFNRKHDVHAGIDYVFGVPPIEYQEEHEMITRLQQKTQSLHRGKEIGLPYATDGGILVSNTDIPFVIFGPGSRNKLHVTDECIHKQEIINYANLLLTTLLDEKEK